MTTGLVIGKFMPPHAGHCLVIDTARAAADHVVIILFAKPSETIDGRLRLRWMRAMYPDLEIRYCGEDYPVDYNEDRAWDFWIGIIRRLCPVGPDVVFSSEGYGEELARRLGARHHPVDPERRVVPVSASAIRTNPIAHWEYLPRVARPHFVKRIAIIGPESTGKTTLAQQLAASYGTTWAPEYAREYLELRGSACAEPDFLRIARGRAELEERAAEEACRLLFADTEARTTALWSERYFSRVSPELRALADASKYDLYLLESPDTPWVADGLRDSPHLRDWFFERMREELTRFALRFRVLSGNWDQRFQTAKDAIQSELT